VHNAHGSPAPKIGVMCASWRPRTQGSAYARGDADCVDNYVV